MTSDARRYPARPLLAVSLAVVRDGRVLLASRVKPPYAGCFTLPGGLVEPGERLEAAALRELGEEVDVEAKILGFNAHAEVIERDEAGRVRHHYVIASFVGAWRSGEGRAGEEAAEVIWADRADVARLKTTDGLPVLLERAFAMAEEAVR